MRTREEQIADIFPGFCAEDADETITKGDLRALLEYAERRAEQRVRAEIGRDSERLDWFENNCASAKSQWNEAQCLVEWEIKNGEWHPSFRAAIDAARNGGE